jgi:hypothetical protein
MIVKEDIITKLEERLQRKCTAIELTHWAKGLMFDCFEGKQTYDPDHKEVERAVLRIANSSTNHRTFLFNSEIVKLLAQLGRKEASPATNELYGISIILGRRDHGERAVKIITDLLPIEKRLTVREQGSGLVISAERMSEEEINKLSAALHAHSFIMSLRDFHS